VNGRLVFKRTIQGMGLLFYVLLICPFLIISLFHYLIKKGKEPSLYVRAVYRVPLLYEFHNRIFTFPVWEQNFLQLPALPGRTLHLACGTGFGAGIIEQKALETVHLDIKERFVHYGVKRKKLTCAVTGDAYRLPFKKKSFDRIVIPVAFHHLLDHASLFAELKRVMQNEGLTLIFDPVSIRPRESKVANTFHDGLIWIFDHKGILKTTAPILEKNGLEVRSVTYFRPFSLQNYNLVYPMKDMILELGAKAQRS
jgi:ubiquinone/menaquinone biosynthesis C-methylase UbiE